jgi:hypothetical protein
MSVEATPLSAWDSDVAQMIDVYRALFLERFQDYEPIAEDCQVYSNVIVGNGLAHSELSAVLFRNEENCWVVDQRQATIVVPTSFGYRTSLRKGVLARFAAIEIKAFEPKAETTVEKKYLVVDDQRQGTRPLSALHRHIQSLYAEEDGGSKKHITIDSERESLTTLDQLNMFFEQCVNLVG